MENEKKEGGISSPLIEELRKRLLSRGPELNEFNSKDLDHIQTNDLYVWSFLKHKDYDVDQALEMMVDCLKWREKFGINDIVERNIDRRLFEIGFLYPRNKDNKGNLLLLYHAKSYKKELYDFMEVKKLFAFGLEKLATSNPGKKVTLIFDMQLAVLSNMDMDLIKFVITCFQTYFPNMLEYLIVFETPWILTAAWKIVKTWLSTELISKIKFVNKTEILQYVDQDQLLTSMGGTDGFVYKYPPQLFSKNSPNMHNKSLSSLMVPSNKNDVFSSISLSIEATTALLKAHEEFALVKHNGELTASSNENSLTDGTNVKIIKPEEKSPSKRKKEEKSRRSYAQSHGPLVKISPFSELVFSGRTDNNELLQTITISNTVSSPVAFKVKTTSPESFRVKPSSGPILPGNTVEVYVNLQPGHEGSVSKDKFLILSALIPQQKNKKMDLSAIWKSIPKTEIMEQRIRCRYDCSSSQSMESDRGESSDNSVKQMVSQDPLLIISKYLMEFDTKMQTVQMEVSSLEKDLKIIFRLLIVLVFLFVLLLIIGLAYLAKDYLS